MDSFRPMGRKLSRRNKWRRWPPDRGAGAAESQAAAARGAGSWPPGSIFWFGAHGLQTRIRASFDENRHCYRRSPRHLRRHLPAAQTNRQRNPQRRQRNPPVRGETNGAAGRRIAELERPKAKERQREGGRLGASITNAGFGPMEPKPSQRHTDKEVGAALASPPAPTSGSNESTTQPAATTKKSACSRRNKWRRWPPDRRAGTAESQAAATGRRRPWPPGSIFWLGAHGPQARIGASFDENRHCYRRSPRHLRRHLPAAQTNRQRNPQRVGGVGGPAPLSRGRPRLALSYLRGSLHLQNSKRVAHQHI